MGFFDHYQKEGRGVNKDEKSPRLVLFFQIFFRKFWNLIVLNMLYVLFCIPIVTIGPATAGISKVLRNYAREEHAFLWGDFFEAFKSNFKQGFLYGLAEGAALIFLIWDLLLVSNITNPIMMVLSLAAIFLTITIIIFMNYYVYPMMVTFKLSFKDLLRNAFIFCWAGFWRNLLITVVIFLVTVASIQLNVIGFLFVLTTIFFSFKGLLINFVVYPLIKKHMMDGFDPATGKKIAEEKYEGFEE